MTLLWPAVLGVRDSLVSKQLSYRAPSYRVSAQTSWPGGSIEGLDAIDSLVSNQGNLLTRMLRVWRA